MKKVLFTSAAVLAVLAASAPVFADDINGGLTLQELTTNQ